jgi:GT2 family glycosyltransferase/predicted O-methyltransferase YrrM
LYGRSLELAAGRTIQDEVRRMNIFLILKYYLRHLPPGNIVEFGSYRGGSCIFMAAVCAALGLKTIVYGLDTFAGMPATDKAIDAHNGGDFGGTDLAELREYVRHVGLRNVEFVQGRFEETAPSLLPQIAPVTLAHIDCDIRSSVAYSYEAVMPYMARGGYIVFDDAQASSCLGATEAVEDLLIRRDGLNAEQVYPHYVFRAVSPTGSSGTIFDKRPLSAAGAEEDLVDLQGRLAQSQTQIQQLEERVQKLSFLWSRTTRWKRGLALLALTPVDWMVGCAVLTTEIASLLLGKIGRRNAPLTAPANITSCSIIVPSWEGKDLLAQSLPSLLKAVRRHGVDHEVIVLDNGSTDGTSEYVAEHFPEVRVVRSDRNLFFSGGSNLGIQSAQNDIVVLLNNDMVVHEDFLAPLLSSFAAPDVFAVGSQVFPADPGKPREETGKTHATFNGCDFDWSHEPINRGDVERKYVPVFWGHGGAAAIDRGKFLWLGGFDPHFDPFYVEDADLSYRAWKVGWRCLLAVESHVVHKHRGTIGPRFTPAFINQIIRRNQYLFIWKNLGSLRMLATHFLRSPIRAVQRAGVPGVGIRLELKAFLGAMKRLPASLKAKLRLAQSVIRTDEEVLRLVEMPPSSDPREPGRFENIGCAKQLGHAGHSSKEVSPARR